MLVHFNVLGTHTSCCTASSGLTQCFCFNRNISYVSARNIYFYYKKSYQQAEVSQNSFIYSEHKITDHKAHAVNRCHNSSS